LGAKSFWIEAQEINRQREEEEEEKEEKENGKKKREEWFLRWWSLEGFLISFNQSIINIGVIGRRHSNLNLAINFPT